MRTSSLLGMTFLVPFVLGKALGDLLHNASYWWIPDSELYQAVYWSLLIVTGFSFSVFILANITETPRWLLTNYKLDKAEKLIEKISRTNGRYFQVSVRLESQGSDEDEEKQSHLFVKQTRRQRDGAICSENVLVSFEHSSPRLSDDISLEIRRYSLTKLFDPETIILTLAIFFNILIVSFSHLIVNIRYERADSNTYINRLLEIGGLVTVMLLEGFIGRRRCLIVLLLMVGASMFAAQLVLDANPVIVSEDTKYLIQTGMFNVVDFW